MKNLKTKLFSMFTIAVMVSQTIGQPLSMMETSTVHAEESAIVVGVDGVQLSTESETLVMGHPKRLSAKVTPNYATNKEVTWSSSDESVVRVTNEGLVEGRSEGTAVVMVTTVDGGYREYCEITVQRSIVDGIHFLSEAEGLLVGETKRLPAQISPDTARNRERIWTSSDETVATVTNDGEVKALNIGTAVVTVTTVEGGYSDTCEIVVLEEYAKVDGVELSTEAETLVAGHAKRLSAKVMPNYAKNREVTWTSSDETVAKVSKDGIVSARKEGSAVITAVTADGGYRASCEITVQRAIVDGIYLSTEAEALKAGVTKRLSAQISPDSALNRDVIWTSSDETVVTVTNDGVVTTLKAGTAVVTVTTVEGGYSSSCEIIVLEENAKVDGVELSTETETLVAGHAKNLSAKITPSYAANKEIIWTSSDESVAKVSNQGVVSARKEGSAVVTATTVDGGYRAFCEITVQRAVVDGIYLFTDAEELNVGETKRLPAQISPDSALNREVIWTSSDETVVSVTNDGVIKALKAGTAVVTVTTVEGGFSDSCDIYVVGPLMELENIALNKNASSDSISGTNKAKNAIDGDTASRWTAKSNTSNVNLTVDFEGEAVFSQIKIKEHANRINSFKLQYFDGENWNDFYEGTEIGDAFAIEFEPITGTQIRLLAESTKGVYGASIFEFEVYGSIK